MWAPVIVPPIHPLCRDVMSVKHQQGMSLICRMGDVKVVLLHATFHRSMDAFYLQLLITTPVFHTFPIHDGQSLTSPSFNFPCLASDLQRQFSNKKGFWNVRFHEANPTCHVDRLVHRAFIKLV